MGHRPTESIDAKHQHRLEAYVVRARRVEAHSLAADWDALVALTRMKIEVRFNDGEVRIRHELPPEEVVESAAARLRPILLEQEDCFHLKALAALGYFCRASPRDAEWIRAARTEWKARLNPSAPDEAAYRVMVTNTVTDEDHDLDAHRLAMAWIYGDVVHHDPERRQEGDPFGLRDRFRAAVPLIAWAMVGTIELLNYIRALREDGLLQLRTGLFDELVALESTTWEETAQMFYAPVGAEAPSAASSPMPEGWVPLGAGTDLSVFQHAFGGQLLKAESSPSTTELPSPDEKDALSERWKGARQNGASPPPGRRPAPADFAQETLDFD